jgi:hypothetical protein
MRIPLQSYVRLSAAALALAAAAGAHELKDVSLLAVGGQAQLKLAFSAGPGESEFPLYFQKADPGKGTLTLSFLDTETPFTLGKHALDADAPQVGELTLKKVVSPSGKNFLGIELLLRDVQAAVASGEAQIQIAPKGVLKVMLGKSAQRKYDWSLAKAQRAGDAYLSAKAAPPPASAKREKAKAEAEEREAAAAFSAQAPSEPASPPVPSEPAIPGKEEPSAAAAVPARAARLAEIKLLVTAAQENLLLVFEPPVSPNPVTRRDPKDSSWLEVLLEDATIGLARKDYVIPKSAVYKRVKVSMKAGKLALRVKLAEGGNPNVTPQENGLALTAPGKGGSAAAFTWSTAKPEGIESENVAEAGEPVTSAHADGEAIEAAAARGAGAKARGKGLSSSRVFLPGPGSKEMVVTRDSASLKGEPGANGKLIRKIGVGEKVERLEAKGANVRVAAGQDTGWIRASEAVYSDELTEAQEKAIQGRIAANQARLEAAQARLAAAQAREEAKKRRADSLAAEAERKLAEKQAAKEAKLEAQRQAKLAAQAQPPAGVQEAGAAPNRPGASQAANGAPGDAQAAARTAPGAPQLGIADNPELANKLAQEKLAAEEEKKRIEPEENRITYNSYGRRDPFIPVEQGASDNGIDIDQMKVVGIIWQAAQPMAVLEHNREAGVSFTVKEGDPVHNGRVARITHDAVTFDISEYGISRSYSLRLVSATKEGAKK